MKIEKNGISKWRNGIINEMNKVCITFSQKIPSIARPGALVKANPLADLGVGPGFLL